MKFRETRLVIFIEYITVTQKLVSQNDTSFQHVLYFTEGLFLKACKTPAFRKHGVLLCTCIPYLIVAARETIPNLLQLI